MTSITSSKKNKAMGSAFLAACMGNSQSVAWTGDTSGISCCCSEKTWQFDF